MAGQGTQQSGLTAAGRAENAHKLTGLDVEIQVLHRIEGLCALPQADRQLLPVDPSRLHRFFIGTHQCFPLLRYQGVAQAPNCLTRALLPMPSTPISNMPTTMSA